MRTSLSPGPTHTAPCQCQTLPAGSPEAGTLYICSPADEPAALLLDHLSDRGSDLTELRPGVLAVKFGPGQFAEMADRLTAGLTGTQLRATRALVVAPDVIPSLADLMSTQPLDVLLATARAGWLIEVLRNDRLVTHFQPIVSAADPSEVFGYESLVRGLDADGRLIPPGELFGAARAADLLFTLDRQARLAAIRGAVGHGITDRLFVNFNPSAIYTPEFCLRTTFKAMEAAGLTPDRVVFEVVETDEVRDAGHLLGILDTYRRAGFRVALDDVGAGYGSLNMLTRLRPDFVKLDMELTRGVDRDPYKAAVAGKVLEMARELGVQTVVEGVETLGEWGWAKDHGADFAQGYLFARPAATPPRPTVPAAAVVA